MRLLSLSIFTLASYCIYAFAVTLNDLVRGHQSCKLLFERRPLMVPAVCRGFFLFLQVRRRFAQRLGYLASALVYIGYNV